MQTSQGTIEINLFDQQTPKTVENFLSYVQDDSYNETVIHRSIDNFVIQGGGFTFSDTLDPIT
ncbi:peptidylprolyl isomerase, partial [Pseudomonas sp. SIMBA_068]